jgi:hypothetical protein
VRVSLARLLIGDFNGVLSTWDEFLKLFSALIRAVCSTRIGKSFKNLDVELLINSVGDTEEMFQPHDSD